MQKLTTRVQLTGLIDAAAAIAKEQSVKNVVNLYSQLGLFPITDSPEHKIFDKTELHKSMKPDDITEIEGQLASTGLNETNSWSGRLINGLLQQQHLLSQKNNAGAEGRACAMESLWLSHRLQQDQANALPPFALYHLGLLFQDEETARLLTRRRASRLNAILDNITHDQSPIDATTKSEIKDLRKGKLTRKSLKKIGRTLERTACLGGHLVAAMTAAQKSSADAKAAKGSNKANIAYNNKRTAAQDFAAAYELANKHLTQAEIQSEAKLNSALGDVSTQARTKLAALKTPSATLLMLAVETNITENGAAETAKAGLIRGLGKADMSGYFAELVEVLAGLSTHWGVIDPENKIARVDFWVSALFDFANEKVGQFNQAASLTSLAALYHSASTECQNARINTLQKLADHIAKQNVQSGPTIAGKGAMELAVIATTSPVLQAQLTETINHQLTSKAINRLLTRVAVDGHDTIAPDGIVQSLAAQLAILMFGEGKNKVKGNFNIKLTTSSSNSVATLLADAMSQEIFALLQAGSELNANIINAAAAKVIDANKAVLLTEYDKVYDPNRSKNDCSKRSKERLAEKLPTRRPAITNVNAQLKAMLADYTKKLLPLVQADQANNGEADKNTLEGQLFKAMGDATKTSTTAFIEASARWQRTVKDANGGQQQRAVFQGAAQALSQLFKYAENPIDAARIEWLTRHLEPMLHELQHNIDILNTARTFIAIAESIVVLHQHDKSRSVSYAGQLLRVIKPEHVPASHQLSAENAETLTRFANLAYIVNKRTGDKYREEIGEPLANLLAEAEKADNTTKSEDLPLNQWAKDAAAIDALRAAYAKRENTKQALNDAEAGMRTKQDQAIIERQAEYADLKESARDDKIVAIRKQVREPHQPEFTELDEARSAAHTDYTTKWRALEETVKTHMAEQQYQADLDNDVDIRTLIAESLATVTHRVGEMAKAALPVPENDEHEAAIQNLLARIEGTDDQAPENIDGLDCEAIRDALQKLRQAETALEGARFRIRQEPGFNPAEERERLAEQIRLVQQWKRAAELPVREHVYQQTQALENPRAHIAPALAEQMYPELPELAASLRDTAFDMMMANAPSVRTQHLAAVNFNALALADATPPASLEKIWPAFLFIKPEVIYGEQLLQGGIIDDRVTALLDSNLAPAMRIIMLSVLTNTISAQAESDDTEDMLNTWLLATAITAVIKKEDAQGRIRLETHAGDGRTEHRVAENFNAFSLQGTPAYNELNAIIANLWGRLALTIPPNVVRKNLDRLYKKELKTSANNAEKRIKAISGENKTSPMIVFANNPLSAKPQALLQILCDLLSQLAPQDKSKTKNDLSAMKAALKKATKEASTKRANMTRAEKTAEHARVRQVKREAVQQLAGQLSKLGALEDRKPSNAIRSIAALYLAQTARFGERTEFEKNLHPALINTLVELGRKAGDVQTELKAEEGASVLAVFLQAFSPKQQDTEAEAGPVEEEPDDDSDDDSDDDEEDDWSSDNESDGDDDNDDASAGAGSGNSGSSTSLDQLAGSVEQQFRPTENDSAPAADVLDAMHAAQQQFDNDRPPVDYNTADLPASPTGNVQAWLEQVVLQRGYYTTPGSYMSLINDSQAVVDNAEDLLWPLIGEALPENYRDALESPEHVGEFLENFNAWLSTKVNEDGFAMSSGAALALVIHLAHWGHEGAHNNRGAKEFMTLNATLLSAGISLPETTAAETEATVADNAFDGDDAAGALFTDESDDDGDNEQLDVGGASAPDVLQLGGDHVGSAETDTTVVTAVPPPPSAPKPPLTGGDGVVNPAGGPPPPPPMPSVTTDAAAVGDNTGPPPLGQPSASSATKFGGGGNPKGKSDLLAAIRARGERNDNSDAGANPRDAAPNTASFGS
jgi:hypothetical protein